MITRNEAKSIIKQAIGLSPFNWMLACFGWGLHIFLSDMQYRGLAEDDLFDAWAEYHAMAELGDYQIDFNDCDDDSVKAVSWLKDKFPGCPIGEAWTKKHAFVVAIADGDLIVLDVRGKMGASYSRASIFPQFRLKHGRFMRI